MLPRYSRLLLFALAALMSCDPASPRDEDDDGGPDPWSAGLVLEFEAVRYGDFVDMDLRPASVGGWNIVGLTQGGAIHLGRLGDWETCGTVSEHTRAVALSQDRVFTGGVGARFSLFDHDCAFIRGGTAALPATGPLSRFDVADAYFLGTSVYVALAQPDGRDGALVSGSIPASTDQSVAWRNERPGGQPTSYRSLMLQSGTVAGVHTTPGSQTASIPGLIRGGGDDWLSLGLPEAFQGRVPVRMARHSNQSGSSGLFLVDLSGPIVGDEDRRLFIARAIGTPLSVREVEVRGFSIGGAVEGVARAVQVDEDGHVWLAGDIGIFRSTARLPNAMPPW